MSSYNESGDSRPDSPLLTVKEVAWYLCVSPKTVYRYIKQGRINGVRIGIGHGGLRVSRESFNAYIAKQNPSANEEIAPVEQSNSDSAPPETLAYGVEQAAAMLGVGTGDVNYAIRSGQLYAVRLGTATVIPRGELERLITEPMQIEDFTRQTLIKKGIISKGCPFDNPELYRQNMREIAAITKYVARRVSQIRADYISVPLRLGLDEILQQVGTEVMEGRYAKQQVKPGRERK